MMSKQQIPRVIHFVYFGVTPLDDTPPQDELLESWGYKVRWWGLDELVGFDLEQNIRDLLPEKYDGAADLMRYEILYREGGLYFDTDFAFHNPFPDWWHDCEAIGAWENEVLNEGILGNGFLGCRPGNPFFRSLVNHFIANPLRKTHAPYTSAGPLLISKQLRKSKYRNMTILPSHFIHPQFQNHRYTGGGPVYAQHLWRSQKKTKLWKELDT